MADQNTSLQNIPLFQAESLKVINIPDITLSNQNINAAETVFSEGDVDDYACFTLKDGLAVIKKNMTSTRKTVANIHAGRSIGEGTLVDNMHRSATIQGETACLCVLCPGLALSNYSPGNPP